jgi:hypothetical protein
MLKADPPQGKEMPTDYVATFNTWELFETDQASKLVLEDMIYTSSASSPPATRRDPSVRELCKIRWDTEIDLSSLPTYTNTLGQVFYNLEREVEMTNSGGSVDFTVYHDGKRQGSKHVVVDYESRT